MARTMNKEDIETKAEPKQGRSQPPLEGQSAYTPAEAQDNIRRVLVSKPFAQSCFGQEGGDNNHKFRGH